MPWSAIKEIDQVNPQIGVSDNGQAQCIEALGQAVRLQSEGLDALILDLQKEAPCQACQRYVVR